MDGEWDSELCGSAWLMMFKDVEKQLLSGIYKKKHDKEKGRMCKMSIKLNKKCVDKVKGHGLS